MVKKRKSKVRDKMMGVALGVSIFIIGIILGWSLATITNTEDINLAPGPSENCQAANQKCTNSCGNPNDEEGYTFSDRTCCRMACNIEWYQCECVNGRGEIWCNSWINAMQDYNYICTYQFGDGSLSA